MNYYGAKVTAICNTKNIELIKSLGAEEIINYEVENFTLKNTKYDYILDAVGKSSFSESKHLLKPNGTYISSELGKYAGAGDWKIDADGAFSHLFFCDGLIVKLLS